MFDKAECEVKLKGLVGGHIDSVFGILQGRFCGDDPCFGDFQSEWVPILYPNTI